MNMKLKKLLNDIQKTEDKIAELQEHLKRQNTLRQQMEDIEIVKSFRSMKLDSRSLLVLLDGIQKGTVTIQMDEDAKTPQKKENNAEVHRPPVGQMTEREVLDDEE
jgi:TolA-binding protein